jgi:hypothetical protein
MVAEPSVDEFARTLAETFSRVYVGKSTPEASRRFMKQHNWYSYLRTLSRGIHWANIRAYFCQRTPFLRVPGLSPGRIAMLQSNRPIHLEMYASPYCSLRYKSTPEASRRFMKQHNWYSYLRTLSRGIHWANISIQESQCSKAIDPYI